MGERSQLKVPERIQIVPASDFEESDRWDVHRFWSDDELVKIGEREEPTDRMSFLDEVEQEILAISQEVAAVRNELGNLTSSPKVRVSIGDSHLFNVRKGTRVTRAMARGNPGDIPVYSGRKDQNDALGRVSERWAMSMNIPIEREPLITVNANGYVGATFVRKDKCIVHDDVMAIEVKNADFDLDYVALALQDAVNEGNFEYEAKLYSRVKELFIEVPTGEVKEYQLGDGNTWTIVSYNLEKQVEIASAMKKFATLKAKLGELGQRAQEARIK